jgi:glutamyl-tRNA synthetase
VFDEKKLEWMNGLYLIERPIDLLVKEMLPLFAAAGYINLNNPIDTAYITRVIELLRVRSKRLTEIVASAEYFFRDPSDYDEKAVKKFFSPESADYLKQLGKILEAANDFSEKTLETTFATAAESMGISISKLIHPMRLAVSGISAGPGLFELLATLGKERVVRRVSTAISFFQR